MRMRRRMNLQHKFHSYDSAIRTTYIITTTIASSITSAPTNTTPT